MGELLLIDDDPAVADLLRDILSADGFTVERAASAEAGFARLSAKPLPRAVLLDVMLPGIDGFEALARIRASTETARLPVVMVSTLPERSYRARAESLGADAYLMKPFAPKELIETVRRVAGRTV